MIAEISKSRYCESLQCLKRVWLKKYKPETYDHSYDNPKILKEGSDVGDLAMGLFGDYTEIKFTKDCEKMAVDTQKEMAKGTEIITEASFLIEGGLFASVDILKNLGNGNVELYEVKSSSEVKPVNIHDVAFQYYVLTKAGINVQKACLVHIDNSYVRQGKLNLKQLFKIVDFTDEVIALQNQVKERIEVIAGYMKDAGNEEPNTKIGLQCYDDEKSLHPYRCPFFTHCTKNIPHPNVFDIRDMDKNIKIKLHDNGFDSFEEVLPQIKKKLENTKGDQKKRKKYYQQVDMELHETSPYINKTKITEFLDELHYPLYFLDFETVDPVVPIFDGTKPRMKQVFQYSLHIIEYEGAELKHKEYLGDPRKDSREDIAKNLCDIIPQDACIIVYHSSFEISQLKELAKRYPEYNDRLMKMITQIVDIEKPFQKRWYYTKAMKGSSSIKLVLPALFPDSSELDYANLEGVHDGEEASSTYLELAKLQGEELEKKRKEMLEYCKLDTLGMVKVYEKLRMV